MLCSHAVVSDIDLKTFISSANNKQLESSTQGLLLMHKLNNSGPKFDPWGTPEVPS